MRLKTQEISNNKLEEEIKKARYPIITNEKSLKLIKKLVLYISQREITTYDYSLYKSLIKKKANKQKEKAVIVQKNPFFLDFERVWWTYSGDF